MNCEDAIYKQLALTIIATGRNSFGAKNLRDLLEAITCELDVKWGAIAGKYKHGEWTFIEKTCDAPNNLDQGLLSKHYDRIIEENKPLLLEKIDSQLSQYVGRHIACVCVPGYPSKDFHDYERFILVLVDRNPKHCPDKACFDSELMRFIASLFFTPIFIQSKISLFVSSLFEGSRNGIAEHGRDLLDVLTASTDDTQQLYDNVGAFVLNALTQLEIVRSSRYSRPSNFSLTPEVNQYPLTFLAAQRRSIRNQGHLKKQAQCDACTLKNDTNLFKSASIHQQIWDKIPTDICDTDLEISESLWEFFRENIGILDLLRTRLYCLQSKHQFGGKKTSSLVTKCSCGNCLGKCGKTEQDGSQCCGCDLFNSLSGMLSEYLSVVSG